MKCFENVQGVGSLYLASVLYEFEREPILFICKDAAGSMYFCVCTEIRGFQRWLVAPVTVHTFRKLISNELEIAAFFSNSLVVHTITRDNDGPEYDIQVCGTDLDESDLPEKGTLLRRNIVEEMLLWDIDKEVLSDAAAHPNPNLCSQ